MYAMRTCTHFRLLSLPLVLPLMLIGSDADAVTRARSLRSRFGVELRWC